MENILKGARGEEKAAEGGTKSIAKPGGKVPMNRRTVISLSLVPLACASSTAAAERKKFIGSWRLISGVSTNEVTGAVLYPWGEAGLL